MASAQKTTEEKLRELDRDIARHGAAIAIPPPRPKPLKVAPAPLSRRARLARKILAWSIGLWCAFCFLVYATGEGVLADPIGLVGMAIFTASIGFLLYHGYLWQWALAKEVAGWFRRDRKAERGTD
ncbi:MAG: hypothetical protein HYU62_05440 [Caulobacterales bacterium]|nr:hypothetical protein [Caulobacterales bacterium]